MAVKGYLRIEDRDGAYTLTKQTGATVKLAADEQKIAAQLFRSGDTIVLERKNHSAIGAAKNALKSSLSLAYEKTHFVSNRKAFVTGVVVSAATVAASLVLSPDPEIVVFLGIWLSIWSIGVVFLVVTVVNLWAMVFAACAKPGDPRGQPRCGAVHDRLRDTVLRGRGLRAHHHRAELARPRPRSSWSWRS